MIGQIIHGADFQGLYNYLTSVTKELQPVHFRARNIVNCDDPLPEMVAVAQQSSRVKNRVIHLIVGWAAEEKPTIDGQFAVGERLLEKLDLAEHQALMFIHDEPKLGLKPGDRHYELHVEINRIALDGNVFNTSFDYARVEKAIAEIAEEYAFRQVPGRHNRLNHDATYGAGQRIEGVRAEIGLITLADQIRAEPDRLQRLQTARQKGWTALINEFKAQGIHLAAGPPPRRADLQQGLVMVDASDPRQRIKLSSLDTSLQKWGAGVLSKELGPLPLNQLFDIASASIPPCGRSQTVRQDSPRYLEFLSARNDMLKRRAILKPLHAEQRASVYTVALNRRSNAINLAKKRRQFLRRELGYRSMTASILNRFLIVFSIEL